MTGEACFLIRAQQLLTMTGWDTKPELNPRVDAIEARDRHILGVIEDAAVAVQGSTITWLGPFSECPLRDWPVAYDVGLVTPAWVECHTHALFAGVRAGEFAARNAGTAYVDILEAGGGILSTVEATRGTSDDLLVASLLERLAGFAARGIGTVEVKTGYGLSHDEELRHLRLIEEARKRAPVRVIPTWLGAHAIPREQRGRRERYIDELVEMSVPAVAEQGIAQFCDVFCDRGAFTLEESRRILTAARGHGLELRIHAEEIAHTGGAQMAAELGATSVDHCDHIDEAGIAALRDHGAVATLLPGVTLVLDLEQRPPARRLVDEGIDVALSTDFNPGSCMTQELSLMTTLGCTLLKLTPGEVLWGVTEGGARSLGRRGGGTLRVGVEADVCLFEGIGDYRLLPYHIGGAPRPRMLLGGGLDFPGEI